MALVGVCVRAEQMGVRNGLGKSQVPFARHLVRSKLRKWEKMTGMSDHLSMVVGPA